MLPASDPGALRAFLEHPSRPAGTLTYHELQGFLFTIVSAPELIPASEWLPIIFAGEDIDYASVEQAEAVIGQIMTLSNTINAAVLDPPTLLPADCPLADAIHRVLPTAVTQYTHMGRSIATVLAEPDWHEPERTHHAKIARNEPCPCGSGKKYKKCCGTTVH